MSRTYKDMTFSSMNRFAKSHDVDHIIACNPWTGEIEDLGTGFEVLSAWAASRSKHNSQLRGRSNGHGIAMAALARHTRDVALCGDNPSWDNAGVSRRGQRRYRKQWCIDKLERTRNFRHRHEVRDELIRLRKHARGVSMMRRELFNDQMMPVDDYCNEQVSAARMQFEIEMCYAQSDTERTELIDQFMGKLNEIENNKAEFRNTINSDLDEYLSNEYSLDSNTL